MEFWGPGFPEHGVTPKACSFGPADSTPMEGVARESVSAGPSVVGGPRAVDPLLGSEGRSPKEGLGSSTALCKVPEKAVKCPQFH